MILMSFKIFLQKAEYNAENKILQKRKMRWNWQKPKKMDLKEQITRAVNNGQVGRIETLVGEYGDAL